MKSIYNIKITFDLAKHKDTMKAAGESPEKIHKMALNKLKELINEELAEYEDLKIEFTDEMVT